MPHVTGIGTWFAPGSAAAANNASDDIDSQLSVGSPYYSAGLTGSAGDAITQGAGNLANVSANFDPMDHDGAALGALSTQYLNNFLGGGGMMTDAAKAQAGADLARMNTSQLRQGSEEEANKVGQVQANEAAYNASNATDNRAAQQALALKKAAMQMLISHTNNMTAIERQKLQQGVTNLQSSAQQALQGGANDARSNQMSIYESGRLSGAQTALSIGTGIASGAAGIAGTVGQFMNSQPTSGATNTTGSATGGTPYTYDASGYASPGVRTGGSTTLSTPLNSLTSSSKLALTSNVSNYNQFSPSESNTAYPLASAWGMTSLSSTLPS